MTEPETTTSSTSSTSIPLATKEVEAQEPAPGPGREWALALSGGGYRAMLFHLGSLWRLNEAGFLPRLDRISSVSGGSITAGVLALAWGELDFDAGGVAARFEERVVRPLRALAGRTLDAESVVLGILTPGTIADRVARSYRKLLFKRRTLQDLPERPWFVINATNVQTGALWRFSKEYMGDWRVGRIPEPKLQVATAVAASSAFPPVLSPLRLKLDPEAFTLREGTDLGDPELRRRVYLSDGGVYDNLGLETVAKSYRNLLVSDGGGKLGVDPKPATDWGRHLLRILAVIDNQVRSLRKRQLIAAYKAGERGGAYWGIRTDVADYGLTPVLPAPHEKTLELAATPTRLAALPETTQQRLVNWGYAVTDAALRKHVDPGVAMGSFPYPGGVG